MTLPVGSEYDIRIGPLGSGHRKWLEAKGYAGWIVVTDDNTRRHCLPLLSEVLPKGEFVHINVPAGEEAKTLDTCQRIWEAMFRHGVGRRWCCLNLGGGVIGDMAGFAAATFKRGIDFLQIPTSLLSQVDASVGGKLGIDFYDVKNSIGVFTNPLAVWIDPAFLQTLPPREIRSGFAEIIKHALIADADEWDRLRKSTDLAGRDWKETIAHSVRIKRDIVLQDPKERGLRKALNFGHTIGHAIESLLLHTRGRLLHGEAIAAGMIAEAYISSRQAGLSEGALADIIVYLRELYGTAPLDEQTFDRLIELMRQDKKNESERINFSLLDRPGSCLVNQTATPEMIRESLRYYNRLAD